MPYSIIVDVWNTFVTERNLYHEQKIISFLLILCLMLQIIPMTVSATEAEVERYSILVLDTSASTNFSYNGNVFYTADTAIEYVKASAQKFISDIQSATGKNYVAIVEYKDDYANIVSDFTTNYDKLHNAIEKLSSSSGIRSIAEGFDKVNYLLVKIESETDKKNVVLFTTGMTNEGDYDYNGYYTEETIGSSWYRTDTGVNLYAYSNVAYAAAQTIKEKATLYTVGLFQTMEDMPEQGKDIVQFFKLFTQDMATSENHFYDVKNPDDLKFVFGDIAEEITKPKEVPFNFAGQIEQSKDTESVCYYTDAYFYKSSKIYNPSLATMSLCFELSAWTSHDVTVDNWNPIIVTKNVEKLLTGKINNNVVTDEHLGFSDFQRSDDIENGKPTADSIGAVAAQKQINDGTQDYTLIALAVRGGGYGSEWAGNFTIGSENENEYSDNHKGFELARDGVLEFLTDYIESNNITGNIKLWIVGFSRGAITANMTAGLITEFSYVLPVHISPENIYCYTFETPQGVISDNYLMYDNIHNIINANDLVPLVAPSAWNFDRYCGNVMRTMGEAVISCCGISLTPLEAEDTDEHHRINIENVEDEQFITIDHDMTKSHFISFVSYLSWDKDYFVKLYPEGNAETRLKLRGHGYLYIYCNKHGLMKMKI